ncbi:MAG: methionine synthase [Halanaerobiales bacterium]
MSKLILGASVGNCVHVAGVLNFLKLAQEYNYQIKFLGPAVSINYLLDAVQESEPYMVAVGYRLTPETGYKVLKSLKQSAIERGLTNYNYVFGGTLPVAKKARSLQFFDAVFSGKEKLAEIIAYLKGEDIAVNKLEYSDNLLDRLESKRPFPLVRHHFGLPTVKKTTEGIKKIAASEVLDIISLGPDQNAQESFFRPEEMDENEKGAGGVPLRSKQDLISLYKASRRGNYPLLRSYSGTRDVFKMAKILKETINNAWCAVPLSWYNKLDGRGPRGLLEAIKENQKLMKWHAERNIPVEVNESHHWSLRDAHDTIAVVMAYLAAYNAKKMGVQTYIAQYMFNTPNGTSAVMDIAKMLAKKQMIESLEDKQFKVLTQVRAGLSSFPTDLDRAKGQLAYAVFLGMVLKPDIVHVVSYSEADHAADSREIIESCKIAQQIIRNTKDGLSDFSSDISVMERKQELISDAKILLNAVKSISSNKLDPLSDPETLTEAIRNGLIDAPHLKGNPEGAGLLSTRIIDGACYAYDYSREKILFEKERINKLTREALF